MALVAVAGGGLAGTEAALALAHCGHDVRLYEMRPQVETPAHRTAVLGELVCTNSFKSELPESAHGQLIVHSDSVDRSVAFAAGRYDQAADYLNCPLYASEYNAFVRALRAADRYEGHDWEEIPYFEGCLPIEEMAERGHDTLRFGPMRPTGLRDPRTGRRPHAVVQLRREDRRGQMLNLVGFQTRLRTGEQRRVFGMIPGLAGAEFLRLGSIHRNTFLNFPGRLAPYGATLQRPDVVFAGQLTGVEGYTESAASGLLAAIVLDRILADGEPPPLPPSDTMLGALYRYLREANPDDFQPMNSNWGLVDPMPDAPRRKLVRRRALAARADASFRSWAAGVGVAPSGDRHLAL